jgi:DNA-binding GntR family transcriptional regulator
MHYTFTEGPVMRSSVNTASLSQQVENALKEEIFSGRLEPGQRVSIEKIAEEVGTSYTPVRDAIKRLAAIGMVRISQRKEIRIEQLDATRLRDIFDLRSALETLALRSASKRIPESELQRAKRLLEEGERCLREKGDPTMLQQHDGLVHELIVEHCDNELLSPVLGGVFDLCMWAHRCVVRIEPGVVDESIAEHNRILEALATGDLTKAKRALLDHLRQTLQRTLKHNVTRGT